MWIEVNAVMFTGRDMESRPRLLNVAVIALVSPLADGTAEIVLTGAVTPLHCVESYEDIRALLAEVTSARTVWPR